MMQPAFAPLLCPDITYCTGVRAYQACGEDLDPAPEDAEDQQEKGTRYC